MPGISLIYDGRGGLTRGDPRVAKAADSLICGEDYARQVYLDEGRCFLACVKYPQYPTACFERDGVLVVLEGAIYGRSQAAVRDDLLGLAGAVLGGDRRGDEDLKGWLLDQDGEFIAFLLDRKTGAGAVLNDALGQLPFYFHVAGARLTASRGLGFIAGLMDTRAYDRTAIADYLMLRYSLRSSTLLQGVLRLEPGSLISLRPEGVEVRRVWQYCFDNRQHAGKTMDQNCAALADIFRQACRDRADAAGGARNVVALSGGLDSRIVATGLHAASAAASAATFHDPCGQTADDVRVAEQVARLLGYDWHLFTLRPFTGQDALRLLRMKYGCNYLPSAFMLTFLEAVKQHYGPEVVYWSGDTGLVLRPLTPSRRLKDVSALGRYVLNRAVFSPEVTARMLGLGTPQVVGEVLRSLEAFPEKTVENKHVRFLAYGKGRSWHHEGIDRNRFYFRVAVPLESLPLFKYAMNCPERQKAAYAYFGCIISHFVPGAGELEYAQFHAKVGSRKFALRNWVKEAYPDLSPAVRAVIKGLLVGNRDACAPSCNAVACLRRQIDGCGAILEYLPGLRSDDWLAGCTTFQVMTLLTVTSAIEMFESPRSSIEHYLKGPLT